MGLTGCGLDGGMMKLWIFQGAIAKLDYFWKFFFYFWLFLKVKIQNWNIIGDLLTFNDFWVMPDFYGGGGMGVISRC